METNGFDGIVTGKLHSECDDFGCGVDFKVVGTNQTVEMERDEAVIVPESFEDECFRDSFCKKPVKYQMTGTISQIASSINALGGGKNFNPGAALKKNGRRLSIAKKRGYSHKKPFYVEGGSVVINRTNMLDPKEYTFSGTTYEIASKINSHNGNGVKLVDSDGKKLKGGGNVKTANRNGDCYFIAGKFALDNVKSIDGNHFIGKPYLVHAQVFGQGAISGLPYGHAFIEDDENVYDFSNDRKIVFPKEVYYALGGIEKKAPLYFKYTFKEAQRKMIDLGHYGSWDLKTKSGL